MHEVILISLKYFATALEMTWLSPHFQAYTFFILEIVDARARKVGGKHQSS